MRHSTRWLSLGIAALACALSTTATESGPLPDPATPAVPSLAGTARSTRAHLSKPHRVKTYPVTTLTAPTTLDAAPPNDQCSGAIVIPCGNISLSGSTFSARNDYDFQDTTLSCTSYSASGKDVVYKLNANAGDSIWVNYQSSTDASIYIVTDCAHVQDSCKAGADENHQGQMEQLRYGFPRTATYYLILDSYGLDTDGTWSLVGQFFSCGLHPPPNDRCETATSLYCGSFLFSGDTYTANNDYTLPSGSSCAGSTAQGRDVAFGLSVNAGDSLSVVYTSTTDAVMYVISGCSPSGSPVSCAAGVNSTGVGGTENLDFRFSYTGTYFLILDSDGANTDGGWSLSGSLTCAQAPPTNDACASAFFLPCGPFSLNGDNSLALPDYDPTDSACTGFAEVGSDVVYRIDASAGDSIWCDYVFPHVNGKDDVDAALYLVTDCSDVALSCVAGVDDNIAAQMEHLRYKFTASGTYYMILDCYDSGIYGLWTATGGIICPLVLGVGDRAGPAPVSLSAAFPNPFDRSSTMRFSLPARSRAMLRIHDIAGRVVRTLVDAELGAGFQSITWDARDDQGTRVPGGTYFARLMVAGTTAYRTLIFIR
jgi:hypothetical protein